MKPGICTAAVLSCLCIHSGCARADEPRAEPGGAQIEVTAGTETAEVAEPQVWSDDLPEGIEAQVVQAVERSMTEYSLTEADVDAWSDRILTLPYHQPDEFDREIRSVIEKTTEASWRALPSVAGLLQRLEASVRGNSLEVLGCLLTPFMDPAEIETFMAEAYVPLVTRSTYDVDPAVRARAIGMLGGVARIGGRRGLPPAPECVFERLEELLQDPAPDIVRSVARALYVTGHRDLLTPEQIEEFENGPKE